MFRSPKYLFFILERKRRRRDIMILRDRCGSVNSDVELGWVRTTKPNKG